jgi:hypothetical protein
MWQPDYYNKHHRYFIGVAALVGFLQSCADTGFI